MCSLWCGVRRLPRGPTTHHTHHAGLVLSAIAGVALEPLDPSEYAAGKRDVVEAFNVVAALTVVIQLCTCLFATFTLYMLTSTSHSPQAVYRTTLHMIRWSESQ